MAYSRGICVELFQLCTVECQFMHEKYSSLTEHECVKLVWIPTKLISDEIEYDVIFSVQNIMK